MPTKLNKLIDERQAKTGEPRAVAKRNVRAKLKVDREARLSVRTELVPDEPDGARTDDELSVEEMALSMGYAPPAGERYTSELGMGTRMAEIMSRATMLDRASVGSAMAAVAQSYAPESNIDRYSSKIGLPAQSTFFDLMTRPTVFDRIAAEGKAWKNIAKAFEPFANAVDRMGATSRMVSMLQKASEPIGYGGNALSKVLGEFSATSRAISNVARLTSIYDNMLGTRRTKSMVELLISNLR